MVATAPGPSSVVPAFVTAQEEKQHVQDAVAPANLAAAHVYPMAPFQTSQTFATAQMHSAVANTSLF